MRGKVAKRIRKNVYGDFSSHARTYTKNSKGSCISDARRVLYKATKRAHTRGHV